ncbi:ABC transporter permease [Rhodocytophaga aerolata]|uniref:ABC transporter permease n=1 Tax=Rhodocytophaga aerolata TaxID=455078 RepID=A0ABT8QZL8_9BACT|nr:ABC transporter permease [Rhodocytophaga aerolata]MDO1445289.1 ABC transporter permease [Rhodocytophaga aerolata]
MPPRPPQWLDKILEWVCVDHLLEEIQGDLHERYSLRVQQVGQQKAKHLYFREVFSYIRLSNINRPSSTKIFTTPMFTSYFTIAWRNLSKHKLYSAIKIGGFALGIAACLLIMLFIRDELSYDQHYPNKDRIYRVVGLFNDNGEIERDVWFPAPLAGVLKQDYPEVELTGRINPSELFGAGSNQIRRADVQENSYEEGFTYADQSLLDILQVPMVYGERKHALDKPNTIVLSKSKADKYFPNENPVGKLMILNNDEKTPLTVGGVIEDFPANSHLSYDFLITMTGREFWEGEQAAWNNSNYHTYILFKKKIDPAQVQNKLLSILDSYYLPSMKKNGVPDPENILAKASFYLQPVTDIHLKSDGIHDSLTHGDIRFVYIFGAIAAFILVIACINFVNLSTAKSANRAKEVGVRKVVGSLRGNLINQFLAESMLFSFLSFVAGILLALLLLPYFNSLSAKTLTIPWQAWWLLPGIALSAVVIGLLAGFYPALYLSSFKPIDVLKGKLSRGSKSSLTRSVLVVFQFTTSIILIVGTFVIYRQMNYIFHQKIGFDKDQVLLIQGAHTLGDKVKTLKNELLRLPEVKHVSISDYLPVKGTKRNGNGFWIDGRKNIDKDVSAQFWQVDENYLQTMGMKLVAGRNFSPQLASDSQAVIINETMVRKLGLKDPLNQRVFNWKAWNVIGVVEDFHFESLRDSIQPIVLALGNSPSILSVKINAGSDMQQLLQSVNKVWREVAPYQPIRYTFLDESYARMYDDVQRTGRVFSSFAILAIIVACLGLYGLSSFMVEQRSKEIGIRLVLGASVQNIFGLLTLNFVRLVLISFAIAVPIAWYLMQKWLEDFVYRTEVSPGIFLLAGLAALSIAIFTISYQAIRAALTKPVNNLRTE